MKSKTKYLTVPSKGSGKFDDRMKIAVGKNKSLKKGKAPKGYRKGM